MKKTLYNFIATCILAIGFAFIVQAKDTTKIYTNDIENRQEFSKIVYKEFNISAYGTVKLANKYGKVDAHTWDGSQVKIKVSIIANSNNQAEAEKIFNKISINFYNDANYVKAETEIATSKGWNPWSWDGNSDFKINYDVYYPRGCFLDLSNRYGDSFVGFTNGAVKADIKYGNIRTEDINNSMELNLQYGNGSLGNIQKDLVSNVDYGKLILKNADNIKFDGDYSEFETDFANTISMNSDYSTLRVSKANNLTVNADYGHLKLKEIGNLNIKGDYTDVVVNYLSNYATIDMEYGGINIDKIGKNFSELKVDAEYTDVKVGTEDGCAYRFDAQSAYGDIKYPSGMSVTYEKENGTSGKVEGFFGSKSAKGIVKVNLSYGGIKIR
jgi:Putative adhesin